MQERRQATENAWGGMLLSLGLHGALGALVVFGAMVFPGLTFGGANPGASTMPSVRAHLVNALPGAGLPLPSEVATPTSNRLATANPGPAIGHTQREAAAKNAIPIPDRLREEALAREQIEIDQDKIARTERKADERVASGSGGAVSGNMGSAKAGAGGSGMTFGDASFGLKYAEWENHLADRLSNYWNQQYRDPSLHGGMVTVSFTVDATGGLRNIKLVRSGGLPLLDGMGLKAVQTMTSQELFPLPAGYAKSSLDVTVTFELDPQ